MSPNGTPTARRQPHEHRTHNERDDWEDWEDEDVVTPIMDDDQELIMDKTAAPSPLRPNKPASTRYSQPRYSVQKLRRLKSRQRQKAQNAKAGIKVVTDMATLQQERAAQQSRNPDLQQPKFVDAAALRALEGSPNSASVGNWNWLKKKPDQSGKSPQSVGRSPLEQDLSPMTAQFIYSQATGLGLRAAHDAPPVPSVPSTYKQQERVVSVVLKDNDEDDDDGGSPCTLFEEDGAASNRQRSTKAKEVAKSPDSAATQTRGWWDHITTPFLERKSPIVPTKSGSQPAKETEHGEWWSEKDTNTPASRNKDSELEVPKPPQSPPAAVQAVQRPGLPASPKPSPRHIQAPIVRVPTPRRTPSPLMDRRDPSPACSSRSVTPRPQAQSEKAPFPQSSPALSEQPPPYSPPQQQKAVRYRAVFPAGHPLQALYPPSPGPISPAINGTMSSQGGISMTDIPLTPPARGSSPAQGTHGRLPERLAGTFVPQEHFLAASGDGHRVERERRRHEKEEMAARKLGGFWKGRWCIPASGCYGRSGREGRKRRRVCLGVCGASLALSILIIVLCVTLIPRNSAAAPVDSIFVNLTSFPPMPTGVLSVVGPDNTAAVTGCSSPSTVWSCALPKEEHDSVAPYRPNQPTFIMQIQWDNNTRNLWDVPNGEPPQPGFGPGSGTRPLAE
ncbi:glycoprotease family protein [Colletotrichum tofieldiae]|nr:glycoprotease family protein [Colletotrichum tofieldiae]